MTSSKLQIIISAKDEATKQIQKISGELSKMASGAFKSVANAGGVMAQSIAVATGALSLLGASAVKGAANFEQIKIAMTTMTGSAEKAGQVLDEVSKFAAETPFEFPELATTVKQLMAFGFETDDAIGMMKRLGDISAGLSVPIGDLAYLMGTMRAQGRAFTVDINQFANRGLPIYGELAKVLGVDVGQVRDLVEQGKVGFPEVSKAIENMTSAGGKFYGMMAAQSTSLTGLFSTLRDNVGFLMREIVGIDTKGNVREGSIFDTLRKSAAEFIAWTDAHKEEIVAKVQAILDGILRTASGIFATLKTVFEPVAEILSSFLSDPGNRSATFFGVMTAISVFLGAWAISVVASMAVPIAIFAAIALAVGFLCKVWTEDWGGIQEKTRSVVEAVSGFYSGYILPFFDEVARRVSAFGDEWALEWAFVKITFENAWNILKGVFGVAWALFSGAVKIAIDIFTGNWGKSWEDIQETFRGVFEGIKTIFDGIWGSVTKSFTATVEYFEEKIKKIKDGLSGIGDKKNGNDGRAVGGSVMMNKPYWVGENGPELFVPNGSGRIENNSGSVNGSPSQVFNFDFSGAVIGDKQALIREIEQCFNRNQELTFNGMR